MDLNPIPSLEDLVSSWEEDCKFILRGWSLVFSIVVAMMMLSVGDGCVAYAEGSYMGYLGFWTDCRRNKCANVGQVTEKEDITSEDNPSCDLMLPHRKEAAQITDAVTVLDLPTWEPDVGSTVPFQAGAASIQINVHLGQNVLHGAQAPGPKGGGDVTLRQSQCVDLMLMSNTDCSSPDIHMMMDFMLCNGNLMVIQDTCRTRLIPGPSSTMWLLLTFSILLTSAGARDLREEECAPHSQPWQVALFQRGPFNCGASLFSPQWVLSAAHCRTRFMRVRLGEHNLRKRDGPGNLRAVSLVILHPGPEARSHRHDVVLKLALPARLTRQVRPVALPTRCLRAGEACVVSGWGLVLDDEHGNRGRPEPQVSLPDTLHCANISIISTESCNREYPGRLRNSVVCAGVEGGGTDSCEGDSGGLLVCGGILQGIVSWGDVPCNTTTKPGVYIKVCRYLEWIRETMRRN
ncbi:kallikrein-15 [Dugong dugon]